MIKLLQVYLFYLKFVFFSPRKLWIVLNVCISLCKHRSKWAFSWFLEFLLVCKFCEAWNQWLMGFLIFLNWVFYDDCSSFLRIISWYFEICGSWFLRLVEGFVIDDDGDDVDDYVCVCVCVYLEGIELCSRIVMLSVSYMIMENWKWLYLGKHLMETVSALLCV